MRSPFRSPRRVIAHGWRLLVPILGLAFVFGCGGSDGRKPTFKVSGSINSGGKPLAGAMLTLHPLDSKAEECTLGFPRATSQADGKFTMSTYGEADGAPAGQYAVTVQLLVPCSHTQDTGAEGADDEEEVRKPLCDKFDGKYSDPQVSAWKVTVTSSPVEVPVIEVR